MVRKLFNKIKIIGLNKTVKLIYDELVRPFVPIYYKNKWKICSRKNNYKGICSKERNPEIIVSLTTYPARIESVHIVIETLLMQTFKPDRIILWLAEEQFPDKVLPDNLTRLKKYGLSIKWCEDIKSYKKLVPTLREFPQAIIITADDDMYYHSKMVERLYKAYLKEPNYIHCHRVTKFAMENNEYKTFPGGYDVCNHPSFLHKLTGCSGVCYPPNSLFKDITNEKLFMELAPTNDDIWFWFMATLNGYRCNLVKHSCTALYFVENSQDDSLNSINDRGEKLFWSQFKKLTDYYPQIDEILRNEWKNEK